MILTTLAALSAAPSQATSSQTSASAVVNTLMPQPAQLSTHEGRLVVTPSFTAIADHFRDARLDAAIERKLERIKSQTATLMATSLANDPTSAALVVSVDGPGETIQSVDEDETYALEVSPSGAHLRAVTVVGAMRGLETLQQLIQSDATGNFVPAVSIRSEEHTSEL